MSNLLYLDESNGNGIYATKILNNSATVVATATTTAAASTTITANSINNIMTATTNAAAAAVANPTTTAPIHTSVSTEDLSQSLSEYTDADESISAPTEFLAEFLSAVMLKDYKKALKYCKLILQYEPNNATAKEFYPLILDKLRGTTLSDSDENYNKSSSPEIILDMQGSDPSAGESDGGTSDDQLQAVDEHGDDYDAPEDNSSREPHSNDSHMVSSQSSSSCGSAGISLSDSVEDDEEDDEEDNMSSSGDDLPSDEPMDGSASDEADGADGKRHVAVGFVNNRQRGIVNGNDSRNSSSGGENRSRSDNTTHSYSSLLLEEEDDIVPASLQFQKDLQAKDLDVSNGNKIPSASCSDSESPTEPLTQRLAAILRSKCSISTGD